MSHVADDHDAGDDDGCRRDSRHRGVHEPEQARGKAVDKRADIWAFGCVLYEMLTGQRAFGGEDVTDTLARVVEREPDFDALSPSVPARVRQALRVCLRKDPKQRVGDIRDVRLALEGAFETAVPQTAAPVRVPQWRRVGLVGASGIVAGGVIIGTLVWFVMRPPAPRVMRTTITPTAAAALTINGIDRDLAITPDGSRIVYVGANGTQLFVRALDALEPVVIFKGNPRGPFVSPDGQWVGFVDGRVVEEGGHDRGAGRHAGIPRRHSARRDLGARRDDDLRDQQPGDRAAARLSRRRHA